MTANTFFPDPRAPKSPKRVFASLYPHKSQTQPPPMPTALEYSPTMHPRKSHTPSSSLSSTNSLGLGYGAQVVRTPSDALKGVPQPLTPGVEEITIDPALEDLRAYPATAPIRKMSMEQGLRSRPSQTGAIPHHPFRSTTNRQSVSLHNVHHQRDLVSPTIGFSSGEEDHFASDGHPSISPTVISPSMSPRLPRLQPSLGSMTFDPFTVAPPSFKMRDKRKSSSTTKTSKTTESRRMTLKPPPKTSLPPTPFSATLLSKSVRHSPTSKSDTFITLEFGYCLDEPLNNSHVTLPWSILRSAGGHLASFVEGHLEEGIGGMGDTGLFEEDSRPDMTDGSSADDSDLDSDYGLGALLRDEYLKSLLISTPTKARFGAFPSPPPRTETTGKKRGATRNQYIQKTAYPSPSSALSSTTTLNIRRRAPSLKVKAEEISGGGTITELKILLLRDAGAYHIIAARLINGTFGRLGDKRKKVEDEVRWLGMDLLVREVVGQKGRSMVLSGGEGYI